MVVRLIEKEVYRDNDKLKKTGITQKFTKQQLDEMIKCANDPIYFIKNYVKIVNVDGGLIKFDLYPFQEELVNLMEKERFIIAKVLRQAGKTSTVVAYLLWVTLFKEDQSILIAANKKQVAADILEKYKLSYENIPMWMQQGVEKWNVGDIGLENGSKIRAASTTSGTARSGSYNIVLLDEFAHIQPKMASDFYASVYPVISSGKTTKIIMISTPKGLNLFYKFWTDAKNKKNRFIPFEVSWRDVPGRDEEWYEETIENIGNERFAVEFECQFHGSTNTLISGIKLQGMPYNDPIQTRGSEEHPVHIHEHPKLQSADEDGKLIDIDHKYVIVVDPSEGKKLDYSAFTVTDITQVPYKVVAKFYDNTISPILLPSIIYDTAKLYNNAMVLIELQSTGLQIADILQFDLEYEYILRTFTGNKKAQTISAGHQKNAQPGVKTTGQVKRIGCANLKTLVETNQLLITDFDIIQELNTFTLQSTGSYAADSDADSDDLVMTLVLFSWLTTQKYFKELVTHDLRKQLQKEILNYSDEEVLPPPKIVTGKEVPLDKWAGSLWVAHSLEHSYLDPYNDYFKTLKKIEIEVSEDYQPWQKGMPIPDYFGVGP